jgi:hypothetical protein
MNSRFHYFTISLFYFSGCFKRNREIMKSRIHKFSIRVILQTVDLDTEKQQKKNTNVSFNSRIPKMDASWLRVMHFYYTCIIHPFLARRILCVCVRLRARARVCVCDIFRRCQRYRFHCFACVLLLLPLPYTIFNIDRNLLIS